MPNTFFAADHHFGHKKILEFKRADGSPLREFHHIENMNYHMVQQHNSVVGPKDTVYFLGDLTLSRDEQDLAPLERMNGIKTLVLGNHDIQPVEHYLRYFKSVKAIHALGDMVLTHVPIHPNSVGRWRSNVHGHLHDNTIADARYYCVSMERLDDYQPISIDKLRNKLQYV